MIEIMIDGGRPPDIRLDAPKCIEFSVMGSADNRKMYLHAVNSPATSVKAPGWHTLMSVVDEVLPVHGLEAVIQNRKFRKAYSATEGKPCKLEQTDEGCKVSFDCTGIYEIIVLE